MIGKGYTESRVQSAPLLHDSQFLFTEVIAKGGGCYLCTGGLVCGTMIVVSFGFSPSEAWLPFGLPSCSLTRMTRLNDGYYGPFGLFPKYLSAPRDSKSPRCSGLSGGAL